VNWHSPVKSSTDPDEAGLPPELAAGEQRDNGRTKSEQQRSGRS